MSGAAATIEAAGMASGAGLRLAECLAAYGRRRNLFRRERGAVGPDGLPPTLALALPFAEPRDAATRLVRLFRAAVEDMLRALDGRPVDPAPFLVLLPAWSPPGIRAALAAQAAPDWPDVRFVQGPDANGLALLAHACQAIDAGRFPAVVVAAVDSLANADHLDRLMLQDGLLSRATPYGVVPGEAACVLLLTAAASPAALGRIRDVRATEEPPAPPGSLRGRPLGRCLQDLAAALAQAPPAGRLLTDLSGPRARAEAFGVAAAMGGPSVADLAGSLEAPSSVLGDTGEASGLVLVCLALGKPPAPYPDADVALVVTAARPGGAIVERHPGPAGAPA